MLDQPSVIHAQATSQKSDALKHPTARAFDPGEWKQALDNALEPTDRDRALVMSALWFGLQIQLLRRGTDRVLNELGRREAVMLAVAQLNREYETLQRIIARKRHEDRALDVIDLQYASQRSIRAGVDGNSFPIDDLNDALVDTLPVWLYQALRAPLDTTAKDVDLTSVGATSMRAFSLERTLTTLWQQSLWLDWRFSKSRDQYYFKPHDRNAETLRHAWLWRQQSIALQKGFTNIATEQFAKKAGYKAERISGITIVGQEARPGKSRKFTTGRITAKVASHVQRHMWKGAVENSYVGMFLDAPLPKLGLSCNELQQVWCIIVDACAVLTKKCADSRPVNTSTIREWALTCSRNELVTNVAKCCNRSVAEVDRVVAFLTYDGSDFRRGVWSMPLVKMPDQDFLLMCRSPLEIGNPVRRVEQWLERGGLSDQLSGARRGNSYEAWVRDQISASLSNNELLKDVASINAPIKPADRSIGDIDAAFRLKDLIFVAEIKCLLTPSEPIEQHRYRNKMEGAAKQAIRKARWLSNNIHLYKLEFGLNNTDDLEFVPIVLTNQGYGFSLKFENCLVCDFHFLENYLGDNVLVVGGAADPQSGKIAYLEDTIYRSEDEARTKLLTRIQSPPTLKRYIDRAEWFETTIPCYNEPTNKLIVAGARLSPSVDEKALQLARTLSEERGG